MGFVIISAAAGRDQNVSQAVGPAVGHQMERGRVADVIEADIDVGNQGYALIALPGGCWGFEWGIREESGGDFFI